ncbi:AzlD domain-containing protein [Catenuloplanes japonicus]|uniref:AzlD domain-containing protein n=1 Tax=Catenuloplanes japonicus TaxID=33876 RepID=UPI0006907877|nr:AzlD domain-containing protein [Catenuloplanes japonicus]
MLIAVIAALAVGTYAFRVTGVLLQDRLQLPPRIRHVLPPAAAALLGALAATAALTENGALAGVARPAGVLVGVLLAWRKAPFTAVVVTAAATTALLRFLGLP